MRTVSFKISPDFEEKVNRIFQRYAVNGESETDRWRDLLVKLDQEPILDIKSTPTSDSQSEQKTDMEEFPCEIRVLYNGENYCVKNPPRGEKVKTLQFCRICKETRYDLHAQTKVAAEKIDQLAAAIPTAEQSQAMLRDPKRPFDKYGMVYCSRSVGMWVYPSKCKTCKDVYCPQFPNAKKEGESVGA